MEEKWLPVKDFEGLYEVSNLGRVKSLSRTLVQDGFCREWKEKTLKQNCTRNRCIVVLCKKGKTYPKLVHRLVAEAFIPNIENKPVVDHIDTNPLNNNVNNLRWVTTQENCMNPLTRVHNSESKKGHPNYRTSPLSKESIERIRRANLGRKLSNEHKQKLSYAHKNSMIAMQATYANLEKAHISQVGSHLSEETKNRISQRLMGIHQGKHWKLVDGKRVWY